MFWLLVSVCKFMCGFHLYVVVDGFSVYMLIAIYKIYVNKIFFSCINISIKLYLVLLFCNSLCNSSRHQRGGNMHTYPGTGRALCDVCPGGGELNRADPGSTASGSVCIRHCPAGSQRCCNLSSVSRC